MRNCVFPDKHPGDVILSKLEEMDSVVFQSDADTLWFESLKKMKNTTFPTSLAEGALMIPSIEEITGSILPKKLEFLTIHINGVGALSQLEEVTQTLTIVGYEDAELHLSRLGFLQNISNVDLIMIPGISDEELQKIEVQFPSLAEKIDSI